MKFKAGDEVIIRKDLVVDMYYGGHIFVSDMKSFCGEKTRIKSNRHYCHFLEIDGGNWAWTDKMLIPYKIKKSMSKKKVSKIECEHIKRNWCLNDNKWSNDKNQINLSCEEHGHQLVKKCVNCNKFFEYI